MGVIKNRTTAHGKNKKKKKQKKKKRDGDKTESFCDLKIFFSVCVRVCVGVGGRVCFDRCLPYGLTSLKWA